MQSSISKFAPTGVVVLMAVYCCWPYLGAAHTRGDVEPPSKLEEIAVSLISPVIEATPLADPFRVRKQQPVEPAKAEAQTIQIEPTRQLSPHELLNGLTLNATSIVGGCRFAMINEKLYALGQSLPPANGESEKLVVTQILPQKVWLSHNGRSLELSYRNTPVTPDATSALPATTRLEIAEPKSTSFADLFFRSSQIAESLRQDLKKTKTEK